MKRPNSLPGTKEKGYPLSFFLEDRYNIGNPKKGFLFDLE
jgi:hypothetical protein